MRHIRCCLIRPSSEIMMRREGSPSAVGRIIRPIRMRRKDHHSTNSTNSSRAITTEGIREIKDGKIGHFVSNSCTTSIAPNRLNSTEISVKQTGRDSIANSEKRCKGRPTRPTQSGSTLNKPSGNRLRPEGGMRRSRECSRRDREWSFGGIRTRRTTMSETR